MKKVIIFLTILFCISLVTAFSLSPSQNTEVKITVKESTTDTSGGEDNTGGGNNNNRRTEDTTPECESSWQCGEWTECIEFTELRSCKDLNQCLEPKIEKSLCVGSKEDIKEFLEKTEPITKLPNWFLILLAILSIIIIILLLIELKIPKLMRKFLKGKKK